MLSRFARVSAFATVVGIIGEIAACPVCFSVELFETTSPNWISGIHTCSKACAFLFVNTSVFCVTAYLIAWACNVAPTTVVVIVGQVYTLSITARRLTARKVVVTIDSTITTRKHVRRRIDAVRFKPVETTREPSGTGTVGSTRTLPVYTCVFIPLAFVATCAAVKYVHAQIDTAWNSRTTVGCLWKTCFVTVRTMFRCAAGRTYTVATEVPGISGTSNAATTAVICVEANVCTLSKTAFV